MLRSPSYPTRSSSFSSTDLAEIKEWTEGERSTVCLTIWVDCLQMQVALCPARATKKPIYMSPISISKASDVYNNFENLSSSFAAKGCTVCYATMSFAGPVLQDHVVITNWRCEPRERVIHFTNLPFDLFPLDQRMFMNDLEAASYGIIARFISGSLPKIFTPLWTVDPDQPVLTNLDGSSLVLWIGAGFTGSFISRKDSADYNCVVSSEAGHAQAYSLPPWDPDFQNERMFISFVSQKLHGEIHQPEWEDFCGYRGLELAYQFIKKIKGDDEPHLKYKEIRDQALNGEKDALEAFKVHYSYIIRAAQSMVMTVRCKRVFIISETQVKNFPIVKQLADQLHKQFINHPRSEWLNKIEVFVQHSTSTFPLSGGLFLSKMFSVTQLSHKL